MNTKEIINKALVKLNLNEPLKAIEIISSELNLDKNNLDLLLILGISYMRLESYDKALINFKKIIKINPSYKEAYFNIATVYNNKNKLYDALKYLDKLTNLDKSNFKAYSNKCFIKIKLRDFENALKDANTAIQLNDEYLNAYLQRGNIYKELKNFSKSEADYNYIIKCTAKNTDIYYEANYNKSQLLLLNGLFKEGFMLYENRFYLKEYNSININQPNKKILSLNNIKNKTILVLGEQGIGDNIQFFRYLKLLKDRCSKLFFCVDKKMKNFFQKIKIADKVYTVDEKIDHFDYHVKLMSLPHLFDTNDSSIPDINFTIKADKEKLIKWTNLLQPYKNFYKIGINTKANLNIPGRDVPISIFNKISKFKKIKLFSLQKNKSNEFDDSKINVLNYDQFDNELFEDSKALIENLDLVITCDTSIAHLAASMNKNTWIVLNDVPEWRWLINVNRSLWYKKVTLFRCEKKDDWTKPMEEIEALLKKYD